MGRDGIKDSKCGGNARVRVKNMESEDSDEDYVVEADEVYDESEELDSLVGETSEEESCFQEEEEQEDDGDQDWRTVVKPKASKVKSSAMTRKVKGSTRTQNAKVCATRKRSTRPRKNGVRRPNKRRRLRSDSDEDDEELTPNAEYTEKEEEEFPPLKKNTRKRGRTIKEKTTPIGKGKEKVEDKRNSVRKAICGICLTEEGNNTVWGTLNCCCHYFCFSCIFEWSKVETRCPLCKQRFVSIGKSARNSRVFDQRGTVITVPKRDQVYQPSEEELQDFLNPYENMICTECHDGGDDALMLLCDLCDSPTHTYCVGLGREVPEGNWYCDGCRPATIGPSHSQPHDLTPEQRTSTGMSDGTYSYENMAEIDLDVTIPETPVSQGYGFLPSPSFSNGIVQSPSSASRIGVLTVSGRRLIQEQIRRRILSNRISQISRGADISVLGSVAGLGINATQQHSRMTNVWPSHRTQYADRLEENPSHSVQNREFFPARLGHMMRGLGQPSISVNGFYHSQGQWNELDRLNLGVGQSQITVSAQLHPFPSRSNMGPEIGVSPSDQRYEEQVSSLEQQVQTMVRSQLNNLSRDMNLGHNECVEISRRSAYTIMAAIGLEPPRHGTYATQPPICPHQSSLANIEISSMNGCCLVCFASYVKDVVNRTVNIVVQPHLFGFRH